MENIKDKTALITGAASGLGLCYARKLLLNGAKSVALLDLSTSPGVKSAATLEKEFGKGKVMFVPCDVSNFVEYEDAFKKVVEAFKIIDIVINNAGVYNDTNWNLTLRLNVGGVIQGSLLAMDHMGKHKGGKGGILVNISSVVGTAILPIIPVYCASKFNVLAFSRCLQGSYKNTGVAVLVMCPGLTNTALIDDFDQRCLNFIDTDEAKEVVATFPRQEPEYVAEAMMNLIRKCENGSVWITEAGETPYGIEFPPPTRVELNL
ncbi:15-hydroxyprostaglandin dehydrogenase [NAD(+)]-like [Ptiloglossa arizonensis]|uniref:15-hydroxyprostaglandin dehydrogenase [NAD(+)]-like n=1 Tax=Ptiloglossa arizonensis TaxID=3350558 RepID=UPI003F9EBECC